MNILLEKARRMLEENIIPFWQGLRDDEYGGYIGHVDFSMHSDCKAEKAAFCTAGFCGSFPRQHCC